MILMALAVRIFFEPGFLYAGYHTTSAAIYQSTDNQPVNRWRAIIRTALYVSNL